MIVVDTNVIVYLFITGEQSHLASAVLARDPDWVVPALWRSEFRNALVQYMRHNLIPMNDALAIIQAAEEQLEEKEYGVSSERVLALASQSACSAYDCEFVALAHQLNVPLVTADRKVLAAFPHTAVTPQQFLG